jgi:hypothetical protein
MENAEQLNYATSVLIAWGYPEYFADVFLEEYDSSSLSKLTPNFCLSHFKEAIHNTYVEVPEGLTKDIVDVYIQQTDWDYIRETARLRVLGYDHPMEDPDYDEDSNSSSSSMNVAIEFRSALSERIQSCDYPESLATHFLNESPRLAVEQFTDEYVRNHFLSVLDESERELGNGLLADFLANAAHMINVKDIRIQTLAEIQNRSK